MTVRLFVIFALVICALNVSGCATSMVTKIANDIERSHEGRSDGRMLDWNKPVQPRLLTGQEVCRDIFLLDIPSKRHVYFDLTDTLKFQFKDVQNLKSPASHCANFLSPRRLRVWLVEDLDSLAWTANTDSIIELALCGDWQTDSSVFFAKQRWWLGPDAKIFIRDGRGLKSVPVRDKLDIPTSVGSALFRINLVWAFAFDVVTFPIQVIAFLYFYSK